MLANLIPKAREVEHDGQTQSVKGLTVEDFAGICSRHSMALNHFMALARQGAKDGETDEAFNSIVATAPVFISEIVAAACGEPGNLEDARQVPIGWQIKIAIACWELSAVPDDDLKNLVATAISGGQAVASESSKTESPSAPRH